MQVVDANVLLYATNTASANHGRARRWFEGALTDGETVGFAWSVLLAYVRLATHPSVFARPLKPEDAVQTVRGWLLQPASVVVQPSQRHLELLGGLLAEAGTAGNLVPDAHLAALAIEHDATLVSFDADFGRFRGLRWQMPE